LSAEKLELEEEFRLIRNIEKSSFNKKIKDKSSSNFQLVEESKK